MCELYIGYTVEIAALQKYTPSVVGGVETQLLVHPQ